MTIDARGRDFAALNEAIRAAGGVCEVRGCVGQRFIAAGMSGCDIKIFGVPGNALGAYFIGEYLAGGVIAVFGLGEPGRPPVSNFPCTGMHGGKLYVRGACENIVFPKQVSARPAGDGDLEQISALAARYCGYFGGSAAEIMDSPFTVVTPDSRSPYKQMYVAD